MQSLDQENNQNEKKDTNKIDSLSEETVISEAIKLKPKYNIINIVNA